MRLLIIRHGDPDYEQDGLTPLGQQQAAALGEKLRQTPIRMVFASPLGRARMTAQYTANNHDLSIQILPWIREMNDICIDAEELLCRPKLRTPELAKEEWIKKPAAWNIPPKCLMTVPDDDWTKNEMFLSTKAAERVQEMLEGTCEFLGQFGIQPLSQGGYRIQRSLKKFGDVAVFCHQGAGLAWMAMLLGIPLLTVWRSCYIAPTSVTTLLLEENDQEYATFRMISMGDTSHLYQANVENGFSGLLYNID